MKIGNLEVRGNVFLAPMAGITDPPFRRIVQRFGVSALWTEMMSAEGIVIGRGSVRTMNLAGHHVPTIFQISGREPTMLADAARVAEDLGAAAVDVNMGCPSRHVINRGAGAALMKEPGLAGRIVAAIRKAVTIPLTAKIRSGWDEGSKNASAFARVLESEGADALVLHSRTRSNKHSGPASLGTIEEVTRSVEIPVIGNGGIATVEDAVSMMDLTGCKGVMVGRGALGKPWLPGLILSFLERGNRGPEGRTTVLEVIREHFRYQLEQKDVLAAIRRMRKHLGWYSKGFAGGAQFRKAVFREEDPARVMASVAEFFGKALIL